MLEMPSTCEEVSFTWKIFHLPWALSEHQHPHKHQQLPKTARAWCSQCVPVPVLADDSNTCSRPGMHLSYVCASSADRPHHAVALLCDTCKWGSSQTRTGQTLGRLGWQKLARSIINFMIPYLIRSGRICAIAVYAIEIRGESGRLRIARFTTDQSLFL